MTKPGAEAYRLHVLGARDLRAPDGSRVSSVLAQPKRLCLLTRLALAHGPVSRSTLAALFWPESDEGRARNALSQALHYLRRSLGDDVVVSVEGDAVRAVPERLWCDARALLTGERAPASLVAAAERDFFEGWNAEDSQPLQEWLDRTRSEVRARREELLAAGAVLDEVGGVAPGTLEAPLGAAAEHAEARERSAPPRRARWAATVGASIMAAFAVVALTTIARPSPAGVEETTVVVLLPRVDGDGPRVHVSPLAIHDELLAHLHEPTGFRVVSAPYFESIDELRRQMAALDELHESAWVVHVTAVVIEREVKVLGFLYRSPSFELAGVTRFELTLGDDRSALLNLPPEIGRRVSAMVEASLTEEGR